MLVLLGLPPLAARQATPDRLVAIGDIHGAGSAFRDLLRQAVLTDADGRWAGGSAHLVQTGDFTDRGRDVRAVMDLLMRLEREAPTAGGRVQVLLGNHETMNLMAETRDVTTEIFGSFAGDDAAHRRDQAYRDYVAWIEARTAALGRPVANRQSRDQWLGAHPPGFLEYMDALGPDGRYGKWLRSKPIVAQIGDTIFLHGGLDPSLGVSSVAGLNAQASEEIARFDRYRRHLIEQGIILPFSTLSEILAAVTLELQAWNVRISPGPPNPRAPPPSLRPQDVEHLEILFDLQSLGRWSIVDPDGPLWSRAFARWSQTEGRDQVSRILDRFEASRVVVGHSVTATRRISPRFDNRVFLIDTGMLRLYGGRASALEFAGAKTSAIYLDRRDALVQPTASAESWVGRHEVIEEFLRIAEIIDMSEIGIGVTKPMRATLAPGGPVRSIAWKPHTPGESYKAEIAAYELDKLLGLNMVPVTVEKRVNGAPGAAKMWVSPTQSFEQLGGTPTPPAAHVERWNLQLIRAAMFDNLIYNADLNIANWLVDSSWNLILIDHNRAFPPLGQMAHELTKIDGDLWDRMQALDEPTLQSALGEWLSDTEIRATLERRNMMERRIARLVEERGDEAVLVK